MAGCNWERIGIVDIFKDAFRFARENFGILAIIALLGHVLTLAQSTYEFIFGQELSNFTLFLLAVAELFINVWVRTALITSVASLRFGNQFSLAEMKKAVSSKYWGVFVTILKWAFFILIIALPIYFVALLLSLAIPNDLLIILQLSILGLLFYLSMRFQFIIHSAVLEESAFGAFRNSSRLMKGRFWKVAGATLAFNIIFAIIPGIYFFLDKTQGLSNLPAWGTYLLSIAYSLYGVAYMVFEVSFSTLLYLRLKALDENSARVLSGVSIDKQDSANGGHHE